MTLLRKVTPHLITAISGSLPVTTQAGGSNAALLVSYDGFVSSGGAASISSLDFEGNAFTKIRSVETNAGANRHRSENWILFNPPLNTTGNLNYVLGGFGGNAAAHMTVLELNDVDSTVAPEFTSDTTKASRRLALSITPTFSPSAVFFHGGNSTGGIFNGQSGNPDAIQAAVVAALNSGTNGKVTQRVDYLIKSDTTQEDFELSTGESNDNLLTAIAVVLGYVAPQLPVEITVVDQAQNPIEGAAVYLTTSPGGVEVINGLTDANGNIVSTFGGGTPQAVTGQVRSGSGATPYADFPLGGNITSSGYLQTAILQEDD
ncbi:MAG: Ig-like domain-containing protein [Cyanobacteria bacterium J06635_1]